MTYKKIVERMIEMSVCRWVANLLVEYDIDYKYITPEISNIEKEGNLHYQWEVEVKIALPDYRKVTVIAGGTVDDIVGICNSVIWNYDKKKILWMGAESTRKKLGIMEFKIA